MPFPIKCSNSQPNRVNYSLNCQPWSLLKLFMKMIKPIYTRVPKALQFSQASSRVEGLFKLTVNIINNIRCTTFKLEKFEGRHKIYIIPPCFPSLLQIGSVRIQIQINYSCGDKKFFVCTICLLFLARIVLFLLLTEHWYCSINKWENMIYILNLPMRLISFIPTLCLINLSITLS